VSAVTNRGYFLLLFRSNLMNDAGRPRKMFSQYAKPKDSKANCAPDMYKYSNDDRHHFHAEMLNVDFLNAVKRNDAGEGRAPRRHLVFETSISF